MLSILIPTYNFDCTRLAEELQRQITASGMVAEVIVMDDASPRQELRAANQSVNDLPNCRLVQLENNVGIARIRNLLADEAQYDKLLFLDSDVYPVHDDFVKAYLDASENGDVVCGGLLFRDTPPSPDCTLRYKYGSHVESMTVEQRMKEPYCEFRTLSFLISREVFMKVRFNEAFTQYGHEDTFFGKEIGEKGYSILHIDNPIYHDVPDTNEDFLEKTRRSIENLKRHQEILLSHVRLLRFYQKLQKWHIDAAVAMAFKVLQKPLLSNLKGKHPSLKLFNVYKVGYLCCIMRLTSVPLS